MSTVSAPDCLICAQEIIDADQRIFADEDWSAGILPGFEVPGWYVLCLRRHGEGITALNEREAATFGPRLRDLSAAVGSATGAPTVYAVSFGESFPHYHVLVMARTDDVPADRRSGEILKLRAERRDPEAARALLLAVRERYARG